jgi:hypothetical protein
MMALDDSDREDLLREATALVERVELALSDSASDVAKVVVGFRRDGALSVFFGAEPVYQFNAAGELRRAFCDGLLFKAAGGRLVSLERIRTADEVQLMRRDLSEVDQQAFIARLDQDLRRLAGHLETDSFRIVGQVPAHADVMSRVRTWLARHDRWPIANAPGLAAH